MGLWLCLGNAEAQLAEVGRQRLFLPCEHQILRDLRAKSWHNDCFVCCCCLAGARLGFPFSFVKNAESKSLKCLVEGCLAVRWAELVAPRSQLCPKTIATELQHCCIGPVAEEGNALV